MTCMKNKMTSVAFSTAIARPTEKCQRPGIFKNETATVAAVNTSSTTSTAICVRGKITPADIGIFFLAQSKQPYCEEQPGFSLRWSQQKDEISCSPATQIRCP